ncbi:MAG: methyl-accepting chemotaxis protein [Bdellovibrio sp.]|nr:methyl-accepting chemotaxis protein [Bdellovibrio sp.]
MNFSIKTKIIAASSIAIALCLAISLFANWKISENVSLYRHIAEVNFPNIRSQADMEKGAILIEAATNMLLDTNNKIEEAKAADAKIQAAIKIFNDAAKQYEALPFLPGEDAMWEKFKGGFWKTYMTSAEKIIALSMTGKEEDHINRDQFAKSTWSKLVETRDAEFDKIQDFQGKEVTTTSAEAMKQTNLLAWLTPMLYATAGLISLALAFLLGTAISKNLMRATELINDSTEKVASASTQIASSSQQLSQATTEQAASLEETAASLEEISAMVSKAAENASTTETNSQQSQSKAEEGRQAVDDMMKSMTDISESNEAIVNQVNKSNQEMSEIIRVIEEIGNKTKVINEIVFQTKLLSFNASVEAARAGEHGKGFAVVAEEVGNLAQMSGNAAKEITAMLDSSIAKVDTIVKNSKSGVEVLVEQGKQKVESGINVARQCSSVLDQIVQNVSGVTNLAQEISRATKEQSQGIGEINKAVGQLDIVTQQNSATSEETAKAAAELSSQADHMKSAVEELVAAVQGRSKQPSAQVYGAADRFGKKTAKQSYAKAS